MRPALLALVVLGLALGGCPRVPERPSSDWPIARAELERAIPTDDPAETSYRTHCLPCHGVDGRGAGGVTGADFTSPEGPLRRPDAELLVSIRQGTRGSVGLMPAHGTILGDDGSVAVLAYVRRTFGPDIVPAVAEIDAGMVAPSEVAGAVPASALAAEPPAAVTP